jgi:hypothetical protein
MTEAEWLVSGAPNTMLLQVGGDVIDRKRRLLGCGLGRHLWPSLADVRSRDAIAVAERFADGAATNAELAAAEAGARAAMDAVRKYERAKNRYDCRGTAVSVWATGRDVNAWSVGGSAPDPAAPPQSTATRDTILWEDMVEAMHKAGGDWHGELRWLCGAIRCVFGNPFRPVAFPARWRRSAVVKLADAIYVERAFQRLPELANALHDAGCEDADVLAHCRGEGPHVRGCWVLDGVLGKS